jgi:hypothetical protein
VTNGATSDTDIAVADGRRVLERVQGRDQLPVAAAPRRRGELRKRIGAIAIADASILVVATVIGMFVPLGMFGALAVMALLLATTVALAVIPLEQPVRYERLRQADVRALPDQTARWLQAQRAALPAPAQVLSDRIGERLAALTPQLARLEEDAPAAAEVRKLVGEQLPDFVRGYNEVPRGLRTTPRNGKTPDQQLIDGLGVIDGELADMSAQLAQGQLDSLETRGRYLEIKYKGDGS